MSGAAIGRWCVSFRADDEARPLADRHYNRQNIGATNFTPPGRCRVFMTECKRALWVTSWPFAEYVMHAWAGAWINSTFRNEGAGLSSELIREAVATTLHEWPTPPALGMVTFVDPKKVRHKRRGEAAAGSAWRPADYTNPCTRP